MCHSYERSCAWNELEASLMKWAMKKHHGYLVYEYMGVSKNRGTPKSSILMRFSIINHPFWGTPIFGNIHMYMAGYIIIIMRTYYTIQSHW